MGTEEIVVASLLNTANNSHNLRSAFTRGSLRGSVYLECLMNQALVHLLTITPGIILTQRGVRYQAIKASEHLHILRMKNSTGDLGIGKWVRASKGLYWGDIGLIVGSHSWGSTVLLVPRIPPLSSTNVPKRKATIVRPPARLFDPPSYPESSDYKVTHNLDGSYTLGRLVFEHGLVVKEYDYHSISADVLDIPIATFLSFVSCGHPDVVISKLPCPQEWHFNRMSQSLSALPGSKVFSSQFRLIVPR